MTNEKRLIDANVVLAKKFTTGLSDASGNYYGYADVVFADDIENAPTVDDVEVVHGRWEQVQRWATKAKYRCSVCGREIMSATKVNIEKYPYCHCGAKMDGDGNV